jgi:Flp pilus assembly protein TadD
VAGSVARARGLLAAVTGRDDAAVPLLERALEQHRALGLRAWEARSAGELAVARRRVGDQQGAESAHRQAVELAEDLGLVLPADG